MTLIELFKGLLKSDCLDAVVWGQWYVKKDITCRDCLNTYKVQANKMPNCKACGLPVEKLKQSIFKKEIIKDEKD